MNEQEAMQQLFDKSVAGLASQGFWKALAFGNTCAYRGADGMRCALGWLIPDGEYRSEFEGRDARGLLGTNRVPKRDWVLLPFSALFDEEEGELAELDLDAVVEFLQELQAAHDDSHDPNDMRWLLKRLAHDYRLTLPPELAEPGGERA